MPHYKKWAVLVTLCVMFAAVPAFGNDSYLVEEDGIPVDTAPYDRFQVDSYARDFDVTQNEAMRRMALRQDMYPLIEEFRKLYEDKYAGWEIRNAPEYSVIVHLVGVVPKDAARLFAHVPEVNVVGGAALTWAEAGELAESVTDEISKTTTGVFREASVSADPVTGTVEVQVRTVDDEMTPHGALELLPLSVRAIGVDLEVVDQSLLSKHNVLGGGHLNNCTAGWSAKKGSTYGILTAGHCSGQSKYWNHSGTQYNLSNWSGHTGTWGDLGFYKTSGSEIDNFYYKWNTARDTSSVGQYGSLAVGDYLCAYGKTTGGPRCGYVQYTNKTFWSSSTGWVYKQFYVWSVSGSSGDSGGPWYDYRTAWGTHTGRSGTMEVASYADLAWEALGVTVLK